MQTVPEIIRIISKENDETNVLKYENIMFCMFAMPILIFGAIVNLLIRQFIVYEELNNVLIDSVVLLLFAVLLEIILRVGADEKRKADLYTGLSSLILVFVVLRLYYLIGPAVWTISILVVMLSMLRTRKSMLVIIFITIILLGIHIGYKSQNFSMDKAYYIAQAFSFVFLFFISLTVHETIVSRFHRIREQYNLIYASEQKLYSTLESVGDGVIAADQEGRVNFMNPVAQQLTGWKLEQAYGKPFDSIFNIVHEFTREKVESPVQKVLKSEETIELANHTILISRDGTEKAIEDTAAPIKDRLGKLVGVVLVFRDCTESKEKRNQIEYLSYHDQLTGLYNRRFFEKELTRLDKVKTTPISLIFADVNGLKTINDAFGHDYGDQLIQAVAEELKRECRADDIIARIGGDEFVVILPHTDNILAEQVAKRVKGNIEQKRIMDINISISFGWNAKTIQSQSCWEVLKDAEDFMYQKKIYENSSKRSGVIKSILHTLHIKSPRENAHSQRVSLLCEAIGKAYHLSEDDIKELKISGELHDIGKIAIDEVTLNKPDKLSDKEWVKIRQHPETGYRLLSTSNEFYNIAQYVLEHHERWDGKGYPSGIQGEDIKWKSRVIAIADAYDAMTCQRPYRKSLSEEEAIQEILNKAGTQFDPEIVRVFIEKVIGRAC